MVQYWVSSHEWEGTKRGRGGIVISVPDAGRTFNLLMLLLIITFSIATTELQWQETDEKIKNIRIMLYTHTLIYKSCKTAEFSNGF